MVFDRGCGKPRTFSRPESREVPVSTEMIDQPLSMAIEQTGCHPFAGMTSMRSAIAYGSISARGMPTRAVATRRRSFRSRYR